LGASAFLAKHLLAIIRFSCLLVGCFHNHTGELFNKISSADLKNH
jgi:hypothetical protein